MTVSSDYEEYKGGNWSIEINGTGYDENMMRIEFEESVNEPLQWNAKLQGLASDNPDIATKNNVIVSYNGSQAFKGKITEPGRDSREVSFDVEGLGLAYDLVRNKKTVFYPGKAYSVQAVDTSAEVFTVSGDKTKQISSGDKFTVANSTGNDGQYEVSSVSYDSSNDQTDVTVTGDITDSTADGELQFGNTDDIVETVVGSTMAIGTNTRFNAPGSDDFASIRGDDDSKANIINRLVGDYGAEWWVVENSNGNAELQVDSQRGGGSSVKTYDESNTEMISKTPDAGQGQYDGVIVKGYGDGEDQIRATAGSTSDTDDVLVHVDKTIVSKAQAQNKADSLKTTHVDGSWDRVKLKIGDPNVVRRVGDVVTVKSDDANIPSATDYRIVETAYSVDFEGNVEATLICNNRPSTFYNRVEETAEQTKSQTQYMQGSRNVWGEKEVGNATNAEPLTIDVHIPPDVENKVGENKTNKIKLNYASSGFRQSASAGTDVRVSSTNLNTSNKVDSTSSSDDVGVDDDNGVDVERVSQSTIGSDGQRTSNSGSSQVESSSSIESNIKTVSVFSTFTTMDSFSLNSTDTEGIYISVYGREADSDAQSNDQVWMRINDTDDSNKFPASFGIPMPAGTEPETGAAQAGPATFFIPRNTSNKTFEVQMAVDDYSGSASAEDWYVIITYWTVGEHSHDVTPSHDENSNFLSAPGSDGSVNVNTSSYLTGVSDNTSSTVDDVTDNTADSVTTINDDIVSGVTANNYKIKVDGTDVTNNIYGTSNSGTNQDAEVDITSYLTDSDGDGKPDVGWHTVTLIPDQATYSKSRVFLDHKKDT